MMWNEWYDFEHKEEPQDNSQFNFDFFSVLSKPKDYYKILEVDYDASDKAIRSNYIRLALRWHPDKQKSQETATLQFQEISEAYQVLSDPVKGHEYDKKGMLYTYDSDIAVTSQDPFVINPLEFYDACKDHPQLIHFHFRGMQDYLSRYKSLILTCNGLGFFPELQA